MPASKTTARPKGKGHDHDAGLLLRATRSRSPKDATAGVPALVNVRGDQGREVWAVLRSLIGSRLTWMPSRT
jgi:hypothetical protein